MLEADLQQQINQQLFDKLELAYICVDTSMLIVGVSNNLSDYGYNDVAIGKEVADCVDFMFGLDAQTKLDLPMVESPSGIVVSVSLLPQESFLTVLISNASDRAEQRQLLQQKANENELLLEQQKTLMTQLELASKQLESKNRQLEEASRLQTSFLSGVSHEFRTPLTSIIGYTSLVEHSLQATNLLNVDDADANVEHLGAVQRSSKHLLSLVENLLDHGKLDSNELVVRPKSTDLIELFEDVRLLLKPLSDAKDIAFDCLLELGDNALTVVDDSRVRQCLINLLGNAIKFTDIGAVSLKVKLQDEVLFIEVTDTGTGISVEDLEKIRLPFWQVADTGKAGTGLGLTITERIIELMGGQLEISSVLGAGTTVLFSIPAPLLHEATTTQLHTPTSLAFDSKILLAEDDADIADLVVMLMSERGIDVTAVQNGALALDALEKADFDLVLMDIHMPVMTGYETLAVLQQINNPTPVVIMSASAVDADREKAEALGCFDYLIKPVDIEEVIEIINRVIGKPS